MTRHIKLRLLKTEYTEEELTSLSHSSLSSTTTFSINALSIELVEHRFHRHKAVDRRSIPLLTTKKFIALVNGERDKRSQRI